MRSSGERFVNQIALGRIWIDRERHLENQRLVDPLRSMCPSEFRVYPGIATDQATSVLVEIRCSDEDEDLVAVRRRIRSPVDDSYPGE